jgi:predicted nucleic acid-binding protein
MAVARLPNLASGTDVVLGANIFVYAFLKTSQQCGDLLERCAREDVYGFTTIEVVTEVCHRLMLAEAVASGIITKESASTLKGKHAAIQRLTQYWSMTAGMFAINIPIVNLKEARMRRSQNMRVNHGLLTRDSLVLAAADEYGIDALATKDSDFDHVQWVTVYKPDDI